MVGCHLLSVHLVVDGGDTKPTHSRYIYKRKYNKIGSITKYKARLEALVYGQVPDVDVFNTLATVVKSITMRLLLSLAFIFNMHIHRLDVSNAFCYARIEGDVYKQPTPVYIYTTTRSLF